MLISSLDALSQILLLTHTASLNFSEAVTAYPPSVTDQDSLTTAYDLAAGLRLADRSPECYAVCSLSLAFAEINPGHHSCK